VPPDAVANDQTDGSFAHGVLGSETSLGLVGSIVFEADRGDTSFVEFGEMVLRSNRVATVSASIVHVLSMGTVHEVGWGVVRWGSIQVPSDHSGRALADEGQEDESVNVKRPLHSIALDVESWISPLVDVVP
jgi:hypothetical protein